MLIRSSRCGNILNGIFGGNKKFGGKETCCYRGIVGKNFELSFA